MLDDYRLVTAPFYLSSLPSFRPREEVHAAAMARGANCTACPLYGCNRGPVLGELRPGTPITIVSEAPDEHAVELERPFTGWAGLVLDGALQRGGLSRGQASLTSATLCQPPPAGYRALTEFIRAEWRKRVKQAELEGRDPPPAPLLPHQACAPRLRRDLEEARAPTYLAVGALALEQSAQALGVKAARIGMQHGAPVPLPGGGVLMSSYHPSMARRGRKELMPVIVENLSRAAQVAVNGGRVPWSDPPVEFNPTPESALRYLRRLRETNAEAAVDIETDGLDLFDAKILCVGFSAFFDQQLRTLSVPVRESDVSRSLTWPEHIARPVWEAMREVLDHNPLIFHFGLFDTPKLLIAGLMTDTSRSWTDTQVLHKNTTDSDHDHTLGYVARRYFCLEMWKADIDRKNAAKVSGPQLRLYNGRDSSVTRLVAEPLRQQVAAWGNTRQNETDHALLPVIRNMSLMGIPVDEHRRNNFSELCNWQVQRELFQLKEQVGDSRFNPRSTPMVQDLIYGKWGLKAPALEDIEPVDADNTGDWKKQVLQELDYETVTAEEPGSTSAATLTAIVKTQELREDQLRTIQTLLEFRAWDKLRSTYTDNVKVRACDPVEYAKVQAAHGAVARAEAVRVLVFDEGRQDYEEVERLPERDGMSMWRVQFKPGPPTGRLASSPNAQNIPAQGKINMRKMFRAPPGHCWVGADYEQLEARIYAAVADDALLLQAIRDGKDIHSMNAATLLAKNLDEVDYWYKKVNEGDKKYRKYWRNVAKRFCIAEGQRVLTDRGEVPIEEVRRTDLVWDGIEWVHHDGVIYQGIQEVITWDGLTATPDHKVWLEDGRKVQIGYAAAMGLNLMTASLTFAVMPSQLGWHERAAEIQARATNHDREWCEGGRAVDESGHAFERGTAPGPGGEGAALRALGGDGRCMAARGLSTRSCEVCGRELHDAPSDSLRQSPERQVEGVSLLRSAEGCAEVAAGPDEQRAAAVPEPERPELGALRWAWNRIPVRRRADGCGLGDGEPRPRAGAVSRPDRQRGALRAGESALGRWAHQCDEQAEYCATCRLEIRAIGVAFLPEHDGEANQTRVDAGGDYRRGASVRGCKSTEIADRPGTARVYDILNAGPRRRFTVEGRISSNCFLEIYGGSEKKLFDVMAVQRNRDDGKLSFEGLTPDDVKLWHDNWHKLHPETRRFHATCHAEYERTLCVRVPDLDYRARYFVGGPSQMNAVPNMKIQGFASSIANQALLRIIAELPFRSWSWWTGVNLQVHDFIAGIIPDTTEYRAKAKRIWEECMFHSFKGVPFPAKAEFGYYWNELDV